MTYYNDNNAFCCKVLRKNIAAGNLPGGKIDERDIREITGEDLQKYRHIHLFAGIGGFPLGLKWAGWPESLSVITAGFPCQPVSIAGKRLAQKDDRWMWPETARIIRLVQPEYVILENVPGLLSRGFGDVLKDLSSCGYDAEWQSIPAASVGAPHIRQRVFIIAYPNSQGDARERQTESEVFRPFPLRTFTPEDWGDVFEWEKWIHQPELCTVPHGIPGSMDRLKALGNAVVPQVVELIGRCILQADTWAKEHA